MAKRVVTKSPLVYYSLKPLKNLKICPNKCFFPKWRFTPPAEPFPSLKVNNRTLHAHCVTFNLTLLRHEATIELIVVMRTSDSELIWTQAQSLKLHVLLGVFRALEISSLNDTLCQGGCVTAEAAVSLINTSSDYECVSVFGGADNACVRWLNKTKSAQRISHTFNNKMHVINCGPFICFSLLLVIYILSEIHRHPSPSYLRQGKLCPQKNLETDKSKQLWQTPVLVFSK